MPAASQGQQGVVSGVKMMPSMMGKGFSPSKTKNVKGAIKSKIRSLKNAK